MANLAGAFAVLLWALLAILTDLTQPVPPFQLTAMTFAIGALTCLVWLVLSGQVTALKTPPIGAALWGACGLFLYHALYFAALRSAPVAEASLIAYLWPLLIVVLAVPILGERLRAQHIIGVLLGLLGVAILLLWGRTGPVHLTIGHLFAVGCAFIWSSYSVLSRRAAKVPSAIVTYFCLLTAFAAAICHFAVETTAWPATKIGWLSIIGLGLGPVGAAFFLWDIATKRGNIQMVAAFSYAAPVLSTLILLIFQRIPFQTSIVMSAVLVCLGALIAAVPRPKR
ncbi:MAG: EamA family transporter [Deltaproteobacteria bacterium]